MNPFHYIHISLINLLFYFILFTTPLGRARKSRGGVVSLQFLAKGQPTATYDFTKAKAAILRRGAGGKFAILVFGPFGGSTRNIALKVQITTSNFFRGEKKSTKKHFIATQNTHLLVGIQVHSARL